MSGVRYQIELTPAEQSAELHALVKSLNNSRMGLSRKRSLRPSERAMMAASYERAATAVLMAIDAIDIEIAKAAGNQAVANAGRYK